MSGKHAPRGEHAVDCGSAPRIAMDLQPDSGRFRLPSKESMNGRGQRFDTL